MPLTPVTGCLSATTCLIRFFEKYQKSRVPWPLEKIFSAAWQSFWRQFEIARRPRFPQRRPGKTRHRVGQARVSQYRCAGHRHATKLLEHLRRYIARNSVPPRSGVFTAVRTQSQRPSLGVREKKPKTMSSALTASVGLDSRSVAPRARFGDDYRVVRISRCKPAGKNKNDVFRLDRVARSPLVLESATIIASCASRGVNPRVNPARICARSLFWREPKSPTMLAARPPRARPARRPERSAKRTSRRPFLFSRSRLRGFLRSR